VRRHREALHEGEKRTAALIAKQQLLASRIHLRVQKLVVALSQSPPHMHCTTDV